MNTNEPTPPHVTRSWLRFDDVECVRCRRYCGEEGETVYVVEGEGCTCTECTTVAETQRSEPQR